MSAARGAAARGHVPGEPGLWVFLLGDMTVFGLFFTAFVYYRAQEPVLYSASQALLDRNFATLGTLLLLTSSLMVLRGVQYVRARTPQRAPACFAVAWLLGAGFALLKGLEYADKIDAGIGLTSNAFFTFYFMLTGIHLAHVVIGLVLLALVWRRARQPAGAAGSMLLVEGGASYWHMVDLLWIVLFPLLYLMHSA